jgi:hypothetical protein
MKYYAVVTFGRPARKQQNYRVSADAAKQDASEFVGTGTCTAARVYECDTKTLALTADISRVRDGERVIYP